MNNKKMYEVLTEQWGDSDNYVNDLLHYTKSLEKEIEELKQLCDKYEKENEELFIKWLIGIDRTDLVDEYIKKKKEILKGDSNE